MAKQLDVFKCEVCGNIVELLHVGGGELHCCGQAMTHLVEKTADRSTEKHVPVIEKVDGGYQVTVGTTLHPRTDEHFIEWIELIADDKVYRAFLKPGMQPTAFFAVTADNVSAREYCNLHGNWQS